MTNESRKKLISALKEFECEVISKQEELFMLNYLANSNTYFADMLKHHGIEMGVVDYNLNNDFPLLNGSVIDRKLSSAVNDLTVKIQDVAKLKEIIETNASKINVLQNEKIALKDKNAKLELKVNILEHEAEIAKLLNAGFDYESLAIKILFAEMAKLKEL